MGESGERRLITRRRVIRDGTAAGLLVWSAPVIKSFSTPAFADHAGSPFVECFSIKIERRENENPNWICTAVSGNLGTGRCLSDALLAGHPEGCTEFIAGGGTATVPAEGAADKTWKITLPPNCTYGGIAGIKSGRGQSATCNTETPDQDSPLVTYDDTTKVVSLSPPGTGDISHVELVFCCRPSSGTTTSTVGGGTAETPTEGSGGGKGKGKGGG